MNMEGFLLGAGGGSGEVDIGFYPSADGAVLSLALQPDGMIIVGGQFISLGGAGRNRLARLNADGSLDADFNPNANGDVFCAAVQADGRVVVAGAFGSLQPNGAPSPTLRNRLARLNADGTLDDEFNPNIDGDVRSVVIQMDGKMVIAGSFLHVDGNEQSYLARLNADWTLDGDFNPGVDGVVHGVILQADGKVVIGGGFLNVGSWARERIARLLGDPVTESLTVPNLGSVEWMRWDSAPETHHVTFELSTDGGGNWSMLGSATRSFLGW
jgi:uncharacterized delta-60 repeat protein